MPAEADSAGRRHYVLIRLLNRESGLIPGTYCACRPAIVASLYSSLDLGSKVLIGSGAFRVLPGNPDMSYLIQKLEGNQMVGGQMPPGAPLQQAVIDDIRLWITNGALRQWASTGSASGLNH